MKIKQSEVQVGDIILISKMSNLLLVRVEKITKSGSIRYSYPSDRTGMEYYDFKEDVLNFDKEAYIAKPWGPEYQRYFWLLYRDSNGEGSNK